MVPFHVLALQNTTWKQFLLIFSFIFTSVCTTRGERIVIVVFVISVVIVTKILTCSFYFFKLFHLWYKAVALLCNGYYQNPS